MVLLCTATFGIAQTQSSITARVVDDNNQAVPFASVRLTRYNSGVITNADGSFQIPSRPEFLTDTLAISCIGFKTQRVAMADLDLSRQNVIRLQSSAVELKAVEIRAANNKRLTEPDLSKGRLTAFPTTTPRSHSHTLLIIAIIN
ncbi:MAG: carboxypeptidase-like regulatory domain-containing protein [Chryseolinea sp.]